MPILKGCHNLHEDGKRFLAGLYPDTSDGEDQGSEKGKPLLKRKANGVCTGMCVGVYHFGRELKIFRARSCKPIFFIS